MLAAQSARAESHAAQRRRAILDRLASELGQLASARFDTFDLDRPYDTALGVPEAAQRRNLRAAWHAATAYAAADRGWLYLYGPCGSGKSHLAAAAGHALAERGCEVYYRSAPDMLDALRAGYRAGDYDERIEAIKTVAVLVLDDLGTETASEANSAILFQILNVRALYGARTIITSNLKVDELNFRLVSRVRGAAELVPVVASDYRALRGQP
jgi:DNA replication protein DnaC